MCEGCNSECLQLQLEIIDDQAEANDAVTGAAKQPRHVISFCLDRQGNNQSGTISSQACNV